MATTSITAGTKVPRDISYMVTPDIQAKGVWWILWYDDLGGYIREDKFEGTEDAAENRAEIKKGYLEKKLELYENSR